MFLAVTDAPLFDLTPFEMNPSTDMYDKTTYPTIRTENTATISILLQIK